LISQTKNFFGPLVEIYINPSVNGFLMDQKSGLISEQTNLAASKLASLLRLFK
jgi:hypothetical protein